MHDRASSYTSKETPKWLQSHCKYVQCRPTNSRDTNPIENLWAILKAAVDKLAPKTIEDLKRVLFQIWDQIGIQKVNNLVVKRMLLNHLI